MGRFAVVACGALVLALGGCEAASKSGAALGLTAPGMTAFSSDQQVTDLLNRAKRSPSRYMVTEDAAAVAADAPAMSAAPASKFGFAEAAEPGDKQITNVQEQGVDEGGIVKRHGDHLVILRRGRLFTVDASANTLAKVDQADAFPPGAGEAWYDEMLVSGDTVVVIGYSYARAGTELNRFRIDAAGKLTYRDTWHLRSADYYSGSNYASRLIGNKLVVYQPIPIYGADAWQQSLPGLRHWRSAQDLGFKPLVNSSRIYAAAPLRSAKIPQADVFHSVVTCDLTAAELDCDAVAVLGGWSETFYVSSKAVYVWTGDVEVLPEGDNGQDSPRGFVYRLPLDGGKPQALQVKGQPLDQFSFLEDGEKGQLNVLVRTGSKRGVRYDVAPEATPAAFAQLPLAGFGDGSAPVDPQAYRDVPALRYGALNRFVGRYLLYGGGWETEPVNATLSLVPLDSGPVQNLKLPHRISRLDVMGADAIVIGNGGADGRDNALGFTAIGLGPQAAVLDTQRLPAASEGESRSQAFFYRPDPADPSGASGMLALPVSRRVDPGYGRFFGSASAITFMQRSARKLVPAGELAANYRDVVDDACMASCVDWYGNSRPLFLGDRTYALMGYELVEGRVVNGRIVEQRRLNFAPRPAPIRH